MRSEGSRLLAAVDMTQRQIAGRIGVDRSTVALWASGQRIPTLCHRKAMLAAFGIPLSAWPDEWIILRDVVVETLASKAPELLNEIIAEVERRKATSG